MPVEWELLADEEYSARFGSICTFLFPSALVPDPSSLMMASLRFLTSSDGVFCFDLKMKFMLKYWTPLLVGSKGAAVVC